MVVINENTTIVKLSFVNVVLCMKRKHENSVVNEASYCDHDTQPNRLTKATHTLRLSIASCWVWEALSKILEESYQCRLR